MRQGIPEEVWLYLIEAKSSRSMSYDGGLYWKLGHTRASITYEDMLDYLKRTYNTYKLLYYKQLKTFSQPEKDLIKQLNISPCCGLEWFKTNHPAIILWLEKQKDYSTAYNITH